MAKFELKQLMPGASMALCRLLDPARGPLQPPIRSEIFGLHRFAQHGRSLGETHRAARPRSRATTFFPRLRSNIRTLREAHQYIGAQAATGYDVSPAAEWLLDNFHLIEAQLKEIHDGLPRRYFRALPVLLDPPLAGLPRIYSVAWAFVAHTDGAFDEDQLIPFLEAHQETRALNLSELWALPTTLRVVLIENLRRLAERIAANKAAREVANRCCDDLESFSVPALDRLLGLMNRRGVSQVFLVQMAQRLHDGPTAKQGGAQERYPARYRDWLRTVLPDLATLQTQQGIDQTADNLSVSNAVTSLRSIGDADWTDVVARASALMRLMLTSPVFKAEHPVTRDASLHDIERLAIRSGCSELVVAQTLLDLMRPSAEADGAAAVAGFWLRGDGRPTLARALGRNESTFVAMRALARALALPAYLGALALLTSAVVAWMLIRHGVAVPGLPAWLTVVGVALMVFPASETVVAVINRLIAESARPAILPRLALAHGIPAEHRVIVAIPVLLTDIASISAHAHRLHLHFLANPERHSQFALLTDWVDADAARVPADEALLAHARAQIRALNATPDEEDPPATAAPRFILLHRERQFSESEQRWIGWERKRGKLELLVAALAHSSTGGSATAPGAGFVDLGDDSRLASDTRYIVTLDSDTQLPPGRLRELVGVAAHPHNQPRLGADGLSVVDGYGILQPHIATPLPAPRDFTLFHWLFAGQCGIDPYSAASSEIYQDMFGEGTFTGKGLLNVRAMHAVLSGRLPEGQVLSHDLLEGSLARCAALTDITLIEDAPFHADVAAARIHRWTRGDWQLLPFLLSAKRPDLRPINRWKLFDNLRRSLVAPMSLGLLLLTLVGAVVSPWAALALVVAAFCVGPLMGAVAGFAPSRDDVAKRHYYSQAGVDLARALLGGLWHVVQLVQNSIMGVDAIVRALHRTFISRRRLLQWTTAALVQAQARTGFMATLRRHWTEPVMALLLLAAVLAAATPTPALAVALCLLWAASPVLTWWSSRPRPPVDDAALPVQDQAVLEGIARDSWRLFERCVVAAENHLPPDNLQTVPVDMVAHRTSPTNIGLYLLSVACARQFGWIGTHELLARIEATLATLATLQRHRGHFLNWYDTQSRAPLLPMYVSTVDSGNLSGSLLAVAQACLELAQAPHETSAARRAIQASRQRLAPCLPLTSALLPELPQAAALARLLDLPDPIATCDRDAGEFELLLRTGDAELAAAMAQEAEAPAPGKPTAHDELTWRLADHLAILHSVLRDAQRTAITDTHAATTRLQAVARRCEELAWQADFRFLYHRKRHLFHIGYRVAEQELDAGFYDLLASESRLTSVLAIAKGDVPVAHWAALGRPFYAVGTDVGLRSWSGSMFEYLMPSLMLDEPHGSVLRDAGRVAVREQIDFARAHGVPWGISESAYADSDHTLAYQYAPQGVPRLALRRTPPDELVIAPYATALAAQIAPRRACRNFAALEALAARGRYGFIEALDYSPARQSLTDAFTPVATFMSHHHAMSIVALANVLLGGPARRWGMANPHIESVASLLHERAPREVSLLHAPPTGLPQQALQSRSPRLLRELIPGTTALEPTHVLSNGRYTVTLRANGAGWSRWGRSGITRWRDDALRDAYGSFFYLRWPEPERDLFALRQSAGLASITQHPAPDADAQYKATFHADRVCFDATWIGMQAHTTVWVNPEDDIEFRQVELRNLSDRALDIELISAFEVTLADPRADEAHPAFSNLFVRAEWQDPQQALVFERRPRLASEQGMQAAHFLTATDPQVLDIRVQTDRQRWLGRNHASSRPLASFDPLPVAAAGPSPAPPAALDTGLDPVCALAVRLRIAPHGKAHLTFATAASDSSATLRAVIDKYRQPSHVQRASLMSATLTGIRLRALRLDADSFAAMQMLTTALVLNLTRAHVSLGNHDHAAPAVCDRRLLWRFGISGDRPLILIFAGVAQGLGLVRSVARALRIWSWSGIACDLVVVNAEPASYSTTLQRDIGALRERHIGDSSADADPGITAFHLLRADEIAASELSTLQSLACVRLHAEGRPLLHHVQAWIGRHELAFRSRRARSTSAVTVAASGGGATPAPVGRFAATSGEFAFEAGASLRPARPWINVLANRAFGAQISEAGAGYTWAENSRLNQLTAWSNDPVADPPAEWFLIQDRRTRQAWSVGPSAWGDERATYGVLHGQGYSVISHRRGNLEVTATWCVDAQAAVKHVHLRLVNHGRRTLHLRLIGLVEWMMGATRADRSTVYCAWHRQRLPEMPGSNVERDVVHARFVTALLCTQAERAAGFGDGTAFLAMTCAANDLVDWTCDRRECFDFDGGLMLPDTFGGQQGSGLDPCAALSTSVTLGGADTTERTFLLGYAATREAAVELAASAAARPAAQRLAEVCGTWDRLLGATTVKTPDPLFDAMVNRWLLYQTLSSRMWAKAGFYQAGGATGFRDQLQDAMALAWTAPGMLREQIIVCASRQFAEGDVQHWWHAPLGAGVRTHFSDDLLWLAHACLHYLRATGDDALLEQSVPFIEGADVPEGAEDVYETPAVSTQHASVYEHAARTIDRSLRVGAHGLPLMGSGDWNDGMNRVGHEGRGESVWLGWFLCQLVRDFAPLARARGDQARARRWEQAAQGWKSALSGPAWDGHWFKRAFFDDGQALGSHVNAEARIDLIAQAWSVLSGVAPQALQHEAMAAVEAHLVDPDAALIRLLDPPLVHASPSAGYIQAYPPGVRENGGQYAHAGVWALMAQATLAKSSPGLGEDGDIAYRYFTYLSPAHRARHAIHGAAYGLEPYVMAGDVYSQPPYLGRGGWSWYTGAAAWMHRAAVESIFGLDLSARDLCFEPSLPSHWHQAELTLRRDGRTMRFVLARAATQGALRTVKQSSAEAGVPVRVLRPGERLDWRELPLQTCWVIPLEAAPPPEGSGSQQVPSA